MAKQAFEYEMDVEDLLLAGEHAQALVRAEAGLAYHAICHGLHMGRGRALVGLGRAAEALPVFDERVAAQPSTAYPHFYRAVCLALTGRDEDEVCAALTIARERDRSVTQDALRHPAFVALREVPSFRAALKLHGGPALDEPLRRIAARRSSDTEAALDEALALLGTHPDQASVLDAIVDLYQLITDDIDEHGTVHLRDPRADPQPWFAALEAYRARAKALGDAVSAYRSHLDEHDLG